MGWSCPTFHEVRKPFKSDQSCVQGIAATRRSDFYPKHKSHKQMAVQKMQVVVQKMQVKQSFSFVLLLKQETNVRRKERSHEKVRSMPWKAGIGCSLP
jgi:hypothetical protein